jgi:hypothetical protein
MVASFIGVEHHFQQYVRYNVEHGSQFYWCWTANMSYVIPDTLLKVLLNTNKTGHHVICYTWDINNVSGITYNMVTSFTGV